MVRGSGGSKSKITTAVGVEPPGGMRDQKVRAVAARSAFGSQNDKSSVGALLEVDMLKKCTPLWRQAHVEVKV